MAEFQCKACGEPNEFETESGLGREQCVRCRSWNLAVIEGGAAVSEVAMFPSDQPPEWKDGNATVCADCKGIVPEGAGCLKCG